MDTISNVKKIAVLRSNSIGDYIVALPALHALREAYPKAEITLLGQHWHETFLKNRPGPVDRVEVVPFMEGIYSSRAFPPEPDNIVEDFFKKMRSKSFDAAFQLFGGGKYSNPFIKRLGARVSIGMKAANAAELDLWVPYVYYHHEVLRYLEVVSLAGARFIDLDPRVIVTEEDIKLASPFLPKAPFAILNPGASDTRRRWPVEKFAAVGEALSQKGLAIVVTGNKEEEGLAEILCAAMKQKGINTAGKLSLKGLAGALHFASLVISNDTGPLHLARAIGRPTVGIYWVGNAINASPVSVERNRTHISWRLECPACGKNCIDSDCPHRDSFVADVAAVDVVASALDLLKRSGQRSPCGLLRS